MTVVTRMGPHEVLGALAPLILQRGAPDYLHSDNGPEFIAEPLQNWLKRIGTRPIRILPGSRWENGYNERLNEIPSCEVLDAEWFGSRARLRSLSTSGSSSKMRSAHMRRSVCAHQCLGQSRESVK